MEKTESAIGIAKRLLNTFYVPTSEFGFGRHLADRRLKVKVDRDDGGLEFFHSGLHKANDCGRLAHRMHQYLLKTRPDLKPVRHVMITPKGVVHNFLGILNETGSPIYIDATPWHRRINPPFHRVDHTFEGPEADALFNTAEVRDDRGLTLSLLERKTHFIHTIFYGKYFWNRKDAQKYMADRNYAAALAHFFDEFGLALVAERQGKSGKSTSRLQFQVSVFDFISLKKDLLKIRAKDPLEFLKELERRGSMRIEVFNNNEDTRNWAYLDSQARRKDGRAAEIIRQLPVLLNILKKLRLPTANYRRMSGFNNPRI
ncbi:MAG: hypothetical protein V1835_05305 [Candidatus Micrarchaeota archaeon]